METSTTFKSYTDSGLVLTLLIIMTLNGNMGIDVIDAICIYLTK